MMSSMLSTELLPMLLVVLAAGAVATIVVRDHPRAAVVLWLLTLAFVPIWLGVSIAFYFEPAMLLGLLVIVCLLPAGRVVMTGADRAVLLVVACGLLAVFVGGATRTTVFTLLAQYMVPFLLGRVVATRVEASFVYKAIGVIFTMVAGLAVLEFATGLNLFVLVARGNDLYALWGSLQPRGSFVRAEGAFGHSIALGCSLAMAVPMTLASSFSTPARLTMVSLILVAIVLTLSRTAMLCAVASVLLAVAFLQHHLSARVRAVLAGSVVIGAAAAIPFISTVFSEAGSEATGSSAYRGDLVSLIPQMAVIGRSPVAMVTSDGRLFFGSFRSIDNALILFGLTFGALALVIVVGCLAATAWSVVRGRASPPSVAIVGQAPALVTVALITQYGTFFWFVAGLAVGVQQLRSRPDEPRRRRSHQSGALPEVPSSSG